MAKCYLHKDARAVLEVESLVSPEPCSVSIHTAHTVHGPKFWITQTIDGQLAYRTSTTVKRKARQWLRDLLDDCAAGSGRETSRDDALFDWMAGAGQ